MTKLELAKRVAIATDDTVKKAQEYIVAIEDIVMEAIAKEEEVKFSFGIIGGKTKAARKARNPKTGEVIDVPEKHGQPYYKPSKRAKEF